MDWKSLPSPCYVIDEVALRRNLALIHRIAQRSGAEIILALKAFAGWGVFPIMREYVEHATASSLNEARLAFEEMGSPVHAYAPVYTEEDFPEILKYSSHITFNSLTQFERFRHRAVGKVSCGLRINPEHCEVETDLYNPSAKGSRLGITAPQLIAEGLPEGVEGLHFHVLCEGDSYQLEETLKVVEEKFGQFLPRIKWLNMGGGHLMTRNDYDVEHLIKLIRDFRAKYPNLHIVLEPGSAFTWQTGWLVATVEDIVENSGIKTAILNVSFACHMPDCLEMPYKPRIIGAADPGNDRAYPAGSVHTEGGENLSDSPVDSSTNDPGAFSHVYRMGGNSCLAGDYVGSWALDHELEVGERIVFDDMIHYTMVKTTTFNGVAHPSIGIINTKGKFTFIRQFGYEDFKTKLS